MDKFSLPTVLENSKSILVSGAGGGFDVYAGLPMMKHMPEVQLYLDAVNQAERVSSKRPSIVNGSIAAAIEGQFGDYHRSNRTSSSKLFINPLMSLLWAFDLSTVARHNLYLERLAGTQSMREVELAIEGFHATVRCRPHEPIPH